MKRRFEYKAGTSDKFWEIWEPSPDPDNLQWTVRVRFGRNGTGGNDHVNVFSWKHDAQMHYNQKINEKLNKGYHEIHVSTPVAQPKPKATHPHILITQPPEVIPIHQNACEHKTITKISDTHWKCKACGSHVEFDKKQPPVTIEVMETRVRRFIARPA